MGHTDGRWTQDGLSTDLEIFVGASEFKDVANLATVASSAAGIFTLNLAATQAGRFYANITTLLKRTGMLADPATVDNQYGTAASVPGPSAVAGTSGPSGLRGKPPMLGATMPTLAGPASGAAGKGIQVNSVDVIYTPLTTAATTATIGLTSTVFVNNTAPAVTNLITLGNNGLALTAAAQPYRTTVSVASPAMITTSGAEVILNVNITAGGGGTAQFYGAVLKCSYNLN